MNLLNRVMSYDKTKCTNQENCTCEECIPNNEETIKRLANEHLRKLVYYPPLSENEIYIIIHLKYWWKDSKTKLFIKKALKIHGNKYDYSKVVYIKASEKVEIICRKGHDSFPLTPNHHLHGEGCRKCGRITTTNKQRMGDIQFIEDSIKIHGDLYRYNKVKYVSNGTPVKIYCTKCKKYFSQTPYKHLIGRGCQRCGGTKKYTTEEFIEVSEKKFPNLFGYDRVNYVSADELIELFCMKCKRYFFRTPRVHLVKGTCVLCTISKGEEFIADWLNNHNIKYIRQKSFEGCKYKNKLLFDFYIPSKNMCIEYDGEFHFQAIRRSYSITKEKAEQLLKDTQIRDNIKNEFCKNNGITLIRIKYDEDLEKRICEIFNDNLTLFDL